MICTACYREIDPGGGSCPRCGARIVAAIMPPPVVVAAKVFSNPWEDGFRRNPVAAFAETLQRSLFHPGSFFRATAPDRGAGAALLYAAVVGTLSIAVALLWQRALGDRMSVEQRGMFPPLLGSGTAIAGVLALLPIGIVVGNVVWAAVLHVCLAVLGGARGTYATTLKVVCYSSSATAFNVFPVCGAAVGGVWQAVIQVIGLRELHRTSTPRAFWAWVLPFVVAICLAGAILATATIGLLKFWQEFGGRFEF